MSVQDNETHEVNMVEDENAPGYWIVEVIEVGRGWEGRIYQAQFGGPSAQADAELWTSIQRHRFLP